MLLINILISFVFAAQVNHSLIDIPFYFGTTAESKLDLSSRDLPKDSIVINNPVAGPLGEQGISLRLFVFPDVHHNKKIEAIRLLDQKEITKKEKAEKKEARAKAIRKLAKSGLLQDGDIALSFRPYWQKTVPYAHGQMGISHASLVFIKNGRAYNLDMPLNTYYNANLDSEFNSDNFIDVDYLHIIRPQNFGALKENYKKWVNMILKSNPYIHYRSKGALSFNDDYQAPKWKTFVTADRAGEDFILKLGQILKQESQNETPFSLYCSEFAFAMHALSACRPEEIPGHPDCLKVPFGGQPMPPFSPERGRYGLGEGPLAILDSVELGAEEIYNHLKNQFFNDYTVNNKSRQNYVSQIFSSGHEKLSADPMMQIGSLIAGHYYFARLSGESHFRAELPIEKNGSKEQTYSLEEFAELAKTSIAPNYSPTAFLINTFNHNDSGMRDYDYVGTIAFVDDKKYQEAREAVGLAPKKALYENLDYCERYSSKRRCCRAIQRDRNVRYRPEKYQEEIRFYNQECR